MKGKQYLVFFKCFYLKIYSFKNQAKLACGKGK